MAFICYFAFVSFIVRRLDSFLREKLEVPLNSVAAFTSSDAILCHKCRDLFEKRSKLLKADLDDRLLQLCEVAVTIDHSADTSLCSPLPSTPGAKRPAPIYNASNSKRSSTVPSTMTLGISPPAVVSPYIVFILTSGM